MKQLLEKLIATNFADLEGLQISGTVPVKQELMNEVLAEVLKGGQSSSSDTAAPASETATPAPVSMPMPEPTAPRVSSGPRLNTKDLLKFITHAEITAHEGELRLNFEIRR